MKRGSPRSGFAMMLVLVFILMFLAMLGVACRRTASALRIESVRALQTQRDEGSLHALARGLALLENGLPPANPYSCAVEIETSRGPRSYTITFTSVEVGNWTVNSSPTTEGEMLPSMPALFPPSAP